jgi:hypothetical protein
MPLFQYQNLTEPVVNDAPNKVASFWYAPWREPVRTRVLATAVVATTVLAFTPTPKPPSDVTGIKYLPLSEPVRVAPRDVWFQPTVVEPVNPVVSIGWYQPLSQPKSLAPLRPVDFPQPVLGRPGDTSVTGIKFPQWQEPIRTLPRTPWYQDETSQSNTPVVAVTIGWYQPLSTPKVLVAQRPADFPQPVLAQPATDVIGVTYPQWLEPVRSRPRTADFPAFTLGQPASDVTGISYPQWLEPVRMLPRDVWFQPLVVAPEQPVVSFSYYNALAEPVRLKPRAADFPAFTLGQPASDVIGIPYLGLSEPIIKSKPRAADFPAFTFGPPASDVTGISYLALSEPVRFKPRSADFPFYAANIFPIGAVVAPPTAFYNPLSEPVRSPARTAFYQDSTILGQPASDVIGIPYLAWSEPIIKSRPRAAEYPPTTIGVPPTADIRWFALWSEPIIKSRPRTAEYAPTTIGVPPTADIRWFALLSEPLRVAQRTAFYQPVSFVFVPQPLFVPIPLAEPVRVAQRTVWFQTDTIGRPATDVTGIRYLPWTDPVRLPPRTVWFQFLAYTEVPPVPAAFRGWYAPWREPVRTPPRTVWFQPQSYTEVPPLPAAFRGWYAPWREPVRSLPRAVWFDPFTMPPRVIAAFTFGNMAATESGDVFLGALYEFNQVAAGEVGIIIRPRVSGETGLIVPAPVSANVATVAAQPSRQSGAPVTLSSSAKVSIRVV